MKIIVHDGKAHQDDFLGACVCLYKLNAPVYRQKYTEEMLKDPNCWVLDQGLSFDHELHNFDHHHIEQEICAFTMVLDYFYGKDYRIYMPNLQFIEIFDSYGPIRAAEFVGMHQDNFDKIWSPINTAIIRIFSSIEGEVTGYIFELMRDIGKEVCSQIEQTKELLEILETSNYFEFNDIKVLDTTKCVVPQGFKHDQLPTKIYSKLKEINPEVILTIDSRQNGFRMVSINSDSLKFKPNEMAYFTHNSGFLTGFKEYSDYEKILTDLAKKSHLL